MQAEQQNLAREGANNSSDEQTSPSRLYETLLALPLDLLCMVLIHRHPGNCEYINPFIADDLPVTFIIL